jgi:hypothetical protein
MTEPRKSVYDVKSTSINLIDSQKNITAYRKVSVDIPILIINSESVLRNYLINEYLLYNLALVYSNTPEPAIYVLYSMHATCSNNTLQKEINKPFYELRMIELNQLEREYLYTDVGCSSRLASTIAKYATNL